MSDNRGHIRKKALQLLAECYEQLIEHDREYEHRTDQELLKDIKEFLERNKSRKDKVRRAEDRE